ncbi:MAG: hemerythrin domain-containing protein [Ramlibacter sp.]
MSNPTAPTTAEPATPLTAFSQCHEGILSQLAAFAELPALVSAADRARGIAQQTLALFEPGVLEHHRDEEAELFPQTERSAVPGVEADWVCAMAQRLTREHRTIEALWNRVKPGVKLAAAGKPVELDGLVIAELVRAYTAHARFEEEHFLPVAHELLGRNSNHMAALGLSLHMRHMPAPVGYI